MQQRLWSDACAVTECGADPLSLQHTAASRKAKSPGALAAFGAGITLLGLSRGSVEHSHHALQVGTGSCVSIGSRAAFSSPDLMEALRQGLAGAGAGVWAHLALQLSGSALWKKQMSNSFKNKNNPFPAAVIMK